jgi:hypothetical protein
MEYDPLQSVERRYNRMYSYGGLIEKSFWQNVGKIVNKTEIIDHNDMFDKIFGKADAVIRGKNDRDRV